MNIIWELGCLKLILCLSLPAHLGFGEIVVSKKQTNPNFQFYFFFQLDFIFCNYNTAICRNLNFQDTLLIIHRYLMGLSLKLIGKVIKKLIYYKLESAHCNCFNIKKKNINFKFYCPRLQVQYFEGDVKKRRINFGQLHFTLNYFV